MTAPSEIASLYSDVELQARLAVASELQCRESDCASAQDFQERVRLLGNWLGFAATTLAADLNIAVAPFTVTAPGRQEIGTLSSASGNIIIYDGVRELQLPDAALAFLIAREMGHIIGKHHEENTATGIAVSVAVAVLFPVTGLLQGIEAAYAVSTLATTATSFAGSRIIRAMYQQEQRREADSYALLILARAGWSPHDVAMELHESGRYLGGDGWLAELRASRQWLDAFVTGPQPVRAQVALPLVVATDVAASVEIPRDHFGPIYDATALWVVGLLHGAQGIERLCPGKLSQPITKSTNQVRSKQAKPKSLRSKSPAKKPKHSKPR